MSHQGSLGIAAVIGAAVLWGTTGTVQTLLPEGREPVAVGALRLLFGAASLLLLAMAYPAARKALTRLPWPEVCFAGAAIAAYNLLFFLAVTHAGVGIGTAVAIGSAPLWATACEIVIARQWPGFQRAAGQVICLTGLAMLALATIGPASSPLGVGLALAAGACYAVYSLTTSRIGHRAPATAIAAATFCAAAVLASPALFLVPLHWASGPETWLALAFLGVGATGISYALYTWALGRVAASTAVTFALMEPVTAMVLATLVVGEPVSITSLGGVALILGGLALVAASPVPGPVLAGTPAARESDAVSESDAGRQ